jgi:hypothetical protein
MHARSKRRGWRDLVLVTIGCLSAAGCGEGPQPNKAAAAGGDEASWAEQLRPRGDGNLALEIDNAQRYLETVPEATRARFAAHSKNLAFQSCLQLLHVARGRQLLGQFDVAVHYYDQLLTRTDCQFPRTAVARAAALARHGATQEQPPRDPETLAKIVDDLVNYEKSLPADAGSHALLYEIAVMQSWAGKPEAARLSRLLSDAEDALQLGHLDLKTETIVYVAYLGASSLGDRELLARVQWCDQIFRQLTGRSALL